MITSFAVPSTTQGRCQKLTHYFLLRFTSLSINRCCLSNRPFTKVAAPAAVGVDELDLRILHTIAKFLAVLARGMLPKYAGERGAYPHPGRRFLTLKQGSAMPRESKFRQSPANSRPVPPGDGVTPSLLTVPGYQTHPRIVAASALMFEDPRSKETAEQIRRLAPSDANILIIGETGTGKELVARHIHSLSRRRANPFVAVNCAALSETLAESELFGHERGAFTGANATTAGWFETAQGGTLFLDEIGELSLQVQVKLLRVLQEREWFASDRGRPIPIDVRLLAATNVNLDRAMAAGRFREDLYYRIKVAVVSLPPLRERPGDIVPLAHHFLKLYRERLGLSAAAFAPEAMDLIKRYPWPGNVRELENVIHHALLVPSALSYPRGTCICRNWRPKQLRRQHPQMCWPQHCGALCRSPFPTFIRP